MSASRKFLIATLKRSMLIAAAAAILTFAACLAILSQEAKKESDAFIHFSTHYLEAYYETFGSWEGIYKRLDAIISAGDLRVTAFMLKDLDGQPLYEYTHSSSGLQRRVVGSPVLFKGAAVGSFDVSWVQQPVYRPSLQWLALTFGVLGAVLILVFYREMRRHTEQRGQLLDHLKTLVEPEKRNASGLHPAAETMRDAVLRELLHEANVYINKLEVVRRSMVADFSHELRTPISVMRLQLEQALENQAVIGVDGVCSLLEELYRMSKLVHDLQQLSLAETGNLTLKKSWFSIRDLVQATIDSLMPGAEDRAVTIRFEAGKPLSVYLDPDRYQQILINLLGNAIRHSRGQVHVRILHQEASFLLEIEDNGIGIEEEELPYIFERFYRSSNAFRHDGYRGMGLGLAITKSIVTAHGGTIQVESRYDAGTLFRVMTPLFRE